MSTSTTNAQIIRTFGDETRLEAGALPLTPEPAGGRVRVAVAAAAVNPVDLTTRAGKNIPDEDARFPMVLGWDLAGIVMEIGDGVTSFAIGDRVAAMTFQPMDQNGAYRSTIDLDEQLLAGVPDALDLRIAATVPLSGLTGSQIVSRTGVGSGDVLLVNAPLGAVGRFIVQVAAARGVHVVGIAAASRVEEARALGVRTVVPRGLAGDELIARLPGPITAAVDLIGGKAAHTTYSAVQDGGTYVTAVPPYIDETGVFESTRGIDLHVFTVHPERDELAALLQLVASGAVLSPIEREFPLAEAAEAHRLQAAGGLSGKLVLIP